MSGYGMTAVGAERTFEKTPTSAMPFSTHAPQQLSRLFNHLPRSNRNGPLKLLKRNLNHIVSRARIQKQLMSASPPVPRPRMLGCNNHYWSGNRTVQRAPGVRSTLKLPPSRCASPLTNPRPDKRLLGSTKSKPNPSSCTQSSYSPGRRLKSTVMVTCPCRLPPYFAAFVSSSLMINASGVAASLGRFSLAALQSIDTPLPNRVRALAQTALTRSCPFTSVEPRA